MAKAKNVEEYIAQQQAAVAANPDCGTSHYNLAIGLLGLKKYDEAKEELFAAIECSPNLAEAYVQLGGISLQRGDLEGCLMGISDSYSFSWEILRKRLPRLKKPFDGIRNFCKHIQLSPMRI